MTEHAEGDPEWAAEWVGLAADVARLVVAGGRPEQLSREDLAAALGAHRALLELLARMHADVTGLSPHLVGARLTDLEAHPVAALGRLLYEHPHFAGAALTDSLLAPLSATGRQWATLARRVAILEHAWTAARADDRPRGEQAWAVVADLAAVAEAITILDLDLATALKQQGRPGDAGELSRAAGAGLRLTAAEVGALARHGDLPTTWHGPALVPECPAALTALPVAAVEHVAPAQERLAALLRAAEHVTPQDLRIVALQQLRLSLAAAAASPDPQLAAGLLHLAQAWDAVTTPPLRLASIQPSAGGVVEQANAVHWFVSDASPRPELADAAAGTAEEVAAAMSDLARRQLDEGRWMVLNPRSHQHTQPLWLPADRGAQNHPLLAALQQARAQAAEVRTLGRSGDPPTRAPEAAGAAQSPRASLARVIARRVPDRPPDPGSPALRAGTSLSVPTTAPPNLATTARAGPRR